MAASAARRDPREVVNSFADMVRSSWLRTLVGGAAIYACITIAAVNTQNVNLLPAVLVLGALLVPVTFIVYLFERLGEQPAIVPALAVTFAAGGSLGVAAASVLEYQTLRDLGTLPMLVVGLIEESVKLVVPVWLLARGQFRTPADGLLIGVAAGMGFAALETMGYGLAALIASQGRIGPAEEVLLLRGLLSPVGHAAWTGLVCAALWRAASSTGARRWLAPATAFAVAVSLHALWDSIDSVGAHVLLALLSGALLVTQIRLAQRRTWRGVRRELRAPGEYRRPSGPVPDWARPPAGRG
jgi:RsiW-degrading membrane proteinase PrsW (M82 family)